MEDKPVDNVPPLSFEDEDLFAIPAAKAPRGPHTGSGHPDTSHKAAAKVTPSVGSIRRQVEDFARAAGERGFIDDQMMDALSPGDQSRADNSFRPRRVELTDANVLLDSGRRAKNARGNDCVVWVHRDYAFNPPAVVVPAKGVDPRKELKARGKATAEEMLNWSRSMSNEGRMMFSSALKDAAEVMRLLSI